MNAVQKLMLARSTEDRQPLPNLTVASLEQFCVCVLHTLYVKVALPFWPVESV
jgi:hypothetical protein